MAGTLIATQGNENWVLSPDGSFIYVAGNDGNLRVFDARTGESLYSVDLGDNLGAISLSPNGTQLAVVEEVPTNVQQSGSWTQNTADVSFYVVDLGTFGGQEYTFRVTGSDYTFADVTWSDHDTLQLSRNILPGWSGWAPLSTFEVATGSLTPHANYYAGLGSAASLLTIPDSNTVLLGQLGLSSAEYFLIAPNGTALTSNGVYQNDVYGYAAGIEAASGATANDRIVIVTGGDAHLYTGTMGYIGNLASLYPNLGSATGVAFSAEGQRIFFLDPLNHSVVVVDAYNYSLVDTMVLPGANFTTLQWGEEIVVAPDGNGVYYNTSAGISYASVDLPDLGTEAADQLSGTVRNDIIDGRAGADLISGLAGDDWLIGGAGDDQLDGGEGFDTASYETATSGVRVDLGIATAQATGGADTDTLISIEGLGGSIYKDELTGNAGDNVLLGYDGNDTLWGLTGDDDLYGEEGNDALYGGAGVDWLFGDNGDDRLDGEAGADRLEGGAGNDRLDGGAEADHMEGGDGNDTYFVDNAGDVILETATGGYDTMQVSGVSATIATSVEALIIASGAVNATGNFVANSLTGSDQANVLSGLGGNDILQGGAGDDVLVGGSGADTLTGGANADTFKDTAAGLNGDTITDLQSGEAIIITDAALAGFTYSLSGTTLTYTGGSLTLQGVTGQLTASAAAGGGVQLVLAAVPANDARNDFNGDGRSDVLWRNAEGVVTNWLGQANGGFLGNHANAATGVPLDWSVVGTGDFNGDGRDDILWRNSAGVTTNWLGQANGSFVGNHANAATGVPLDWSVVGTGDFNGDGRDDVLWRNSAGVVTDWLGQADGGFASNHANAAVGVALDWTIVGTGDFNGDGRDDILWRNQAGVVTDWLGQANGGFVGNHANAATGVPLDWTIVGTGDFNGDGRDDVLWQNANGTVINWLGQANGGFVSNQANSAVGVGQEWHVAGMGDFNGDGRDDVLWRNDAGVVTNWLGQANGGFVGNYANAATGVPLSWQVQMGWSGAGEWDT